MKIVLICFLAIVACASRSYALTTTGPGPGFLVTQTKYPSLTGNILFGDNASSPLQSLVSTAGAPNDVEIYNGRMYWTQDNTRSLLRASLDGSNVETIFVGPSGPLVDHPVGLAIDPVQQRVYWATLQTSLIRVANLDGSGATTLPLPDSAEPYALAIDAPNRQLYWTSYFDKQIYRTDLNTLASQLIYTDTSSLPSLFGLAVDPVGGKLYWTNRQGPVIRRANLDGSNVETLVTGVTGSHFRDIEIDVTGRAMLWIDDRYDLESMSYVRRANLDGSAVQTLGATNWQSTGLAIVVPEPAALLLAMGAIIPLWLRRHR